MTLRESVFEYLKTVPKGKVVTYAQIAEYLGNKRYCRAVGNILHFNPDPVNYPCYKVVDSKGGLAQNFGDGGINVQRERLEQDGIIVVNYKVDLKKYQYK